MADFNTVAAEVGAKYPDADFIDLRKALENEYHWEMGHVAETTKRCPPRFLERCLVTARERFIGAIEPATPNDEWQGLDIDSPATILHGLMTYRPGMLWAILYGKLRRKRLEEVERVADLCPRCEHHPASPPGEWDADAVGADPERARYCVACWDATEPD